MEARHIKLVFDFIYLGFVILGTFLGGAIFDHYYPMSFS